MKRRGKEDFADQITDDRTGVSTNHTMLTEIKKIKEGDPIRKSEISKKGSHMKSERKDTIRNQK